MNARQPPADLSRSRAHRAAARARHLVAPPAEPPAREAARQRTWSERELAWLRLAHRASAHPGIERFFIAVSKVGDGAAWLLVIALLPWMSPVSGTPCAARMLGGGLANLIIYVALKRSVARPRPFVACADVRACTRALDRYSFPSGHTLHAVAFTVVLAEYFPYAAALAGCFALLVATSRLVLGLHYPTDVAIGAAIGATTASVMFCLF